MALHYARYRLKEWSRYGRDDIKGYPRRWAIGGTRGARDPNTEMPLHIAVIDMIVRQMEPQPRSFLIAHYCQNGSGREKALRMGVSKTTYFRWVEAGEWHVHIELEYSEYLLLHDGTRNATLKVS